MKGMRHYPFVLVMKTLNWDKIGESSDQLSESESDS